MNSTIKSAKKPLMSYGVYIPFTCFIIFSIIDIYNVNAQDWVNYVLSNLLGIALGYQMFFFGLGHIFFGDRIAEYIGWQKGSPFQYELGFAAVGIGTLGILCSWFSGSFWLATIIVSSIFMWGCGIGHIRDMIKNKNLNAGSAGFFQIS
jgi:hypothetical protein